MWRTYIGQFRHLSNVTPKKLVVRNRDDNAACNGEYIIDISHFVQAMPAHLPAHVSKPRGTGSAAIKYISRSRLGHSTRLL